MAFTLLRGPTRRRVASPVFAPIFAKQNFTSPFRGEIAPSQPPRYGLCRGSRVSVGPWPRKARAPVARRSM